MCSELSDLMGHREYHWNIHKNEFTSACVEEHMTARPGGVLLLENLARSPVELSGSDGGFALLNKELSADNRL